MAIIHQLQPTYNSCVSTCVAMLAGVPAERVVDKWNNLYHDEPYRLLEMLSDYDILGIPHSPYCGSIYYGELYLVSVQSLNVVNGLHQIIVDARGENKLLFDPSPREKYTWDKLRQVGIWSIDFRILDCPAMRD